MTLRLRQGQVCFHYTKRTKIKLLFCKYYKLAFISDWTENCTLLSEILLGFVYGHEIFWCVNPSQTNASVSSCDKNFQLWGPETEPQNVALNQSPPEPERTILSRHHIITEGKLIKTIKIIFFLLQDTEQPNTNVWTQNTPMWAKDTSTINLFKSFLTSTLPSGKPNLFWTTAVNSLIRRPFSPRTFWVLKRIKWLSEKTVTSIKFIENWWN